MTATSGNQLAVGARKGWIFELDTNGYPAAPDTSPYEGIEMLGIKAVDLNIPDPRVISHGGNDRNLANDFLPSMEAVTGEARIANLGMPLNAKISNVKQFTIAEAAAMLWATDQQGNEIDIAMHVWHQSLDFTGKNRRWRSIVAPKVRGVPILSGLSENAAEQRIRIVSNPTNKHLWQATISLATEGATEANFLETMTTYHPKLVAWKADGTETEFAFPASALPVADAKLKVWNQGAVVTPTLAVDFTTITFGVAPTEDNIIVAFYEY